MAKYVLTQSAVNDLNEIWNYTFDQWSENQADQYYQMLLDRFNDIVKNPNIGKSYSKIATGLLGFVAKRHVIFYRQLDNETIEITRILHGSMDVKVRMRE